jgi:hypothetical protein
MNLTEFFARQIARKAQALVDAQHAALAASEANDPHTEEWWAHCEEMAEDLASMRGTLARMQAA